MNVVKLKPGQYHRHPERLKKSKPKRAKKKQPPPKKKRVEKIEPPSRSQLSRMRKLEMQVGIEAAGRIRGELGFEEPKTRKQAIDYMIEMIRERCVMWKRVYG